MTAVSAAKPGPYGEGVVYLLHFDPPYKHARHYAGWSTHEPGERLADHDAKLVRAALNAGCTVRIVRVWWGVSRQFERTVKGSYKDERTGRMHNRSLTRLCPCCVPRPSRVGRMDSQILGHHVLDGQLRIPLPEDG